MEPSSNEKKARVEIPADASLVELHAAGSVDPAQCLQDAEGPTSWLDARAINPSEALYYLVRGECSCGQGPYGADSAGTPRLPSAGDCP